jgi:hypothetical protein
VRRVFADFIRIWSPSANTGVAAVEFAIYSLVFLTILAATVDIGRLIFTTAQLDAAVTAGAEYTVNNAAMVASNPTVLSNNISAIIDGAVSSGWATSTIKVNNNTTSCYCPTGTPGNWIWGSPVTCGSSCLSGSGVGGQFVTITATTSSSFSPLISSFGFVKSGTLSRSVIVETQ